MTSFRVRAIAVGAAIFAFASPMAANLVLANSMLAQRDFVNWESPHVHPLELTPDGKRLLAVDTADDRLVVFELVDGSPVHAFDIPVGLDPVSVRAESNSRVWVVNRISDSVSVVDLETKNVIATLPTDDEPADVVFAGAKRRAFVSCSQANTLLSFDPGELETSPTRIAIEGAEPRALAVSSDGSKVYVAIFASGNRSTVLGGGALFNIVFPPNVVGASVSPYSGANPPPNCDAPGGFDPPLAANGARPPKVALIVKQNAAGEWRDDYVGDWTQLVSGPNAAKSGRPVGWELVDHDLAIVDASSNAIDYARGLMNACMALAVNPKSGEIDVVGTDATNEVRFEPKLRGKFLRVRFGRVDASGRTLGSVDLNPHLDYAASSVAKSERSRSIGDPRALVWDPSGTIGYVAGLGSNSIAIVDANGARIPGNSTIDVGEGPTGLAIDSAKKRLYVLCKFESAISVVDVEARRELSRAHFFDPSPAAIRAGRKHLYDTRASSGLGQIACASCHIDARIDHLAWDLGDPSGASVELHDRNRGADNPLVLDSKIAGRGAFEPFHPMKGPMVTQSLQAIIGLEPLHWRGDRGGLEAFAGAFVTLQGADAQPSAHDMQELEDFLATIAYPPNPYRNLDNSLPTDVALAGHFATGRFGPAGRPLPHGNARVGLEKFRTAKLDNQTVNCVTCHTLPTGTGVDARLVDGKFVAIDAGPNGERHHMLVAQDGSTNVTIKVPQLRNLYTRVGFELSQPRNTFGFGFLHDGSVDSLARVGDGAQFSVASDQETADLVAFLLAFSGSDLPEGKVDDPNEPPGSPSLDTHAAVGRQVTLDGAIRPERLARLAEFVTLAKSERVGLVAKGVRKGLARGWFFEGGDRFRSDRASESASLVELANSSARGSELTFTVVPKGCERRIGVDRDRDGVFDRDELDRGSDPSDPASVPGD